MDASQPRIAVIVNASGGRASREGASLGVKLERAFAAAGAPISQQLCKASDVNAAIAAAEGAERIVVGGGDGTQGHAAAQIMRSGQVMAVLPLGTLNHLARDLAIPADLDAAALIAAKGPVETIDLGEVGDIVFVNNASLGLYAHMVRARDASRLPKWLATIPAAWRVLKGMRIRRVELEIDGRRRQIKTPLLFIGNNRYHYQGAQMGQREALSDGVLSVYAVREQGVRALLGFAIRALLGRADPLHDVMELGTAREVIVHGDREVPLAHDGEVTEVCLPLRFRILPRALRVAVPGG